MDPPQILNVHQHQSRTYWSDEESTLNMKYLKGHIFLNQQGSVIRKRLYLISFPQWGSKHNASCLLSKLSKHMLSAAAAVAVSQRSVGRANAADMTCRCSFTIAHYCSDLWDSMDHCTYWPFTHLSSTLNLLCALMLQRKMYSNPCLEMCKRDANSSIRGKFLITFFLTSIWISIWTSFHAWPEFWHGWQAEIVRTLLLFFFRKEKKSFVSFKY